MKPDFPDFIDSTTRKAFVSCGMLANYSCIQHLKPKGTNIHLHFGGCFAKGIEMFRRAFYGDEKNVQESLAAGAEAIILEWGAIEPPEGSYKTLSACLVALLSFIEEYPPHQDPIKPYMTDQGPAVEFSFAVPIPDLIHPQTGVPILYAGRFDMLADYNGALFINDEKTASRLGAQWTKAWILASQITGYVWAARQYKYNVQGAIMRGVGILKSDITHALVIEQRAQWELDRWLTQMKRDVRRMIQSWQDDEWDYALDTACTNYGGCTYATLCKSKNPAPWIESDFEVRPWNPLV